MWPPPSCTPSRFRLARCCGRSTSGRRIRVGNREWGLGSGGGLKRLTFLTLPSRALLFEKGVGIREWGRIEEFHPPLLPNPPSLLPSLQNAPPSSPLQ